VTARLSKEEERQLISRAQRGDLEARNTLIEKNIGLCWEWAHRSHLPRGIEREDLVQEGVKGLIRAIELFDLSKPWRFSTYGLVWIRQAIGRFLEKNSYDLNVSNQAYERLGTIEKMVQRYLDQLGREPTNEEIAAEMQLPLADIDLLDPMRLVPLSMDQTTNRGHDDAPGSVTFVGELIPDEYQFEEEIERDIWLGQCLDELDPVLRQVLEARFGLNDTPIRTLRQLGKEMGRSGETIRLWEGQALDKLRAMLEGRYKRCDNDRTYSLA
jgi:RNA polymerase sigma factor (sigma-70 family)